MGFERFRKTIVGFSIIKRGLPQVWQAPYRSISFLSILVHILVVAFVVAGGDVVHPVLVVEIPTDGLFDTLFKL